jgi:hypothetical protein
MQDTVDQAHGAVPRTLADIIEDARRARLATRDKPVVAAQGEIWPAGG